MKFQSFSEKMVELGIATKNFHDEQNRCKLYLFQFYHHILRFPRMQRKIFENADYASKSASLLFSDTGKVH